MSITWKDHYRKRRVPMLSDRYDSGSTDTEVMLVHPCTANYDTCESNEPGVLFETSQSDHTSISMQGCSRYELEDEVKFNKRDPLELAKYLVKNKEQFRSDKDVEQKLTALDLPTISLCEMISKVDESTSPEQKEMRLLAIGIGAILFSNSQKTREKKPSIKKCLTRARLFDIVSSVTFTAAKIPNHVWSASTIDSNLFQGGTIFTKVLYAVRARRHKILPLCAAQKKKSMELWRDFVAASFYAMLRDKSHMSYLCYCSTSKSYVLATEDDKRNVRQLEGFLAEIWASNGTTRDDWHSVANSYIQNVLSDNRRAMGDNFKKICSVKRTPAYFEEILEKIE